MALTLADLGSKDRAGTIDSFPVAQYLGDKKAADCYVFIRESEAQKAGWKGEIKGEHTFNDGNVEKGVTINPAYMQILRVSGRYVQTRTPDNVNGGNKVTVHGCYDDADAQERMRIVALYRDLKEKFRDDRNSQVSLRTLFLVIFLDPKTKEPLHSIPIIISTAGQAPIQLNNAIAAYKGQWTAALCEAAGVAYSPRDEQTNTLCIYNFKFEPYQAQNADGSASSFIASPTFDGSKITAATVESLSALKRSEETFALYQASDGFDQAYFAASIATSEYQKPFANLPAIPGPISSLPPSTGEDSIIPPVAVQANVAAVNPNGIPF